MGPKAKFEDVDLSEDWCDYDGTPHHSPRNAKKF